MFKKGDLLLVEAKTAATYTFMPCIMEVIRVSAAFVDIAVYNGIVVASEAEEFIGTTWIWSNGLNDLTLLEEEEND